jgi:hypothetical protein
MSSAKNPAYQRRFTLSQNHSASYFSRMIIKPDIAAAYGKPQLPRLLRWRQQQLGRAMSTATQMNRRAVELENFVRKRLEQAYAEHERLKGEKSKLCLCGQKRRNSSINSRPLHRDRVVKKTLSLCTRTEFQSCRASTEPEFLYLTDLKIRIWCN